MPTIALVLIVAVIAAAAGIGGGYFIGYNNRKKKPDRNTPPERPFGCAFCTSFLFTRFSYKNGQMKPH